MLEIRSAKSNECARVSIWRAPSWSWASVDGRIVFEDPSTLEFDPVYRQRALKCNIISSFVQPVSEKAPFGQVQSGYIQVSGHLIECHPVDIGTSPNFGIKEFKSYHRLAVAGSVIRWTLAYGAGGSHEDGTLRYDDCVLETTGTGQTVYLLLLCMQHIAFNNNGGSPELWPFGLALKKLPNGDYARVGCFWGNRDGLKAFGEVERKTITIW